MGTRYKGTFEDRLAHRDRKGRRCDGNNRHCPRTAVEEYDVYRADGFGVRKTDSTLETKKTCSLHRHQFKSSGMWDVVDMRTLPSRP